MKDRIKARGAIIEGVAGWIFPVAGLRGFPTRVVDQFPGIGFVTTLPADGTEKKAIKITEDILLANPKGTLRLPSWAACN